MRRTTISWTDLCWNVTDGCSREMAEGADTSGCGDPTGGGCYAERMAYRFSGPGKYYEGLVRMTPNGPRWTGKLRLNAHKLDAPLRWRTEVKVFVCSTSDPFHPKLTNEEIAAIYGAMAATGGRHVFQMLTKRARRRREWHAWLIETAARANDGRDVSPAAYCFAMAQSHARDSDLLRRPEAVAAALSAKWPLPNVWEGVSVEHQAAAYDRIDHLLMTPAAVRWLSIEPLIGPVDLLPWLDPTGACDCGYENGYHCVPRCMKQAEWRGAATEEGDMCSIDPTIDWVVIGCESGPRARPCDPDWIRNLIEQCGDYRVARWFKQGRATPGELAPDTVATWAIGADDGSTIKGAGGLLVERPYLDGKQYLEMPL